MELADGPLARWAWRGLRGLGGIVGPRAARGLAAAAMRAEARSERGYVKGLLRIARPSLPVSPRLVRLPDSWWAAAPLVRVRRLGLVLELDLRDNLQRTVYCAGTYEPELLLFLRTELRAGDVVVDVGAHVGVHALTAAARLRELGGGTVVAFEPARDSAAKLRAAAARNRLHVQVAEVALGARPGTASLFADPAYDPADAGVRSLHGTGQPVQTISVTTFDAWAAEAGVGRVDLVKLDVEGAEPDVLRGMAGSLGRLRPRALIMERKDAILRRAGVDPANLEALLGDLGYRPTGQVFPVGNQLFRPVGDASRPAH